MCGDVTHNQLRGLVTSGKEKEKRNHPILLNALKATGRSFKVKTNNDMELSKRPGIDQGSE